MMFRYDHTDLTCFSLSLFFFFSISSCHSKSMWFINCLVQSVEGFRIMDIFGDIQLARVY